MNQSKLKQNWIWILFFLILIPVGLLAWKTQQQWMPAVNGMAENGKSKSESGEHGSEEDHHDHDHAGHEESTSLELTPQARKNIGLTEDKVIPVKLQAFTRTLTIPAIVVEMPGKTRVKVVAPMTGIITNVNVIAGEAVQPGRELFKIRLTHEDLVQAQTDFLKTLGELDVEDKEIARIKEITDKGVIAGKVLLEREYAKEKLEAILKAQREALLLHGFSEGQVDQIRDSRRLIKEHQVYAPQLHDQSGEVQLPNMGIQRISAPAPGSQGTVNARHKSIFIVQSLNISKGDFVQAGDTLCVLADYSDLYLKGQAFEQEADELTRCLENGWSVEAIQEINNKNKELIKNLQIDYLDNQIETDARIFSVYVDLPNTIEHENVRSDGERFITWRFKPGQRMQLRIPVETWKKQIVVPVEAIATEGAESFVFQENGDHFDRRPVHVLYKDQLWAVIQNDGAIFPGDKIALTGAHQMQMALKNKAGGAVDPHAGHNH
ncbi:HlyD family efflux transporter periplasmic adaptor subunit [Gimesia chilikensis]|uniref:efflux RND transporter periplasmic adaptor subunit n=1 Tax=Gimesia chilikensis TaxID=2605989 RepID=UPI0011EEB434|nr:HlyD family efflux transporter periplasmic adaptor subunit [Gimesia chilikensis]KAA0139848.1 HlyD family efflux transporter periplasmic adaptor subunit [Gimesia chilikensis]